MRKIFILVFSLFLVFASQEGMAQENINPRNVTISELSDGQVRRIYNEIMNRGLSEQQATSLALARGFTMQQVNALKLRFEELQNGGNGSKESNGSVTATAFVGDLSEKDEVQPTKTEQRLFGFNFFNSESLTFEPGVNLPASNDYIVGPGDEFSIDIWGASQQSFQLMVDNSGNINIPNAGPVSVEGLSLENARDKIFDKLTLIYRDLTGNQPGTFANIYLAQIQPLKVHVIGEAFAPGTYTLPGSASAFNALYLAGGPNMKGSFRDIRVIRDGKIMKHLDVYKYLIDGDSDVNISLRDDDVIMIPSYQKRVKISGEFKRNGIFEGKEGETIADLLRYAGGFTERAFKERLELFRNDSRQTLFKEVKADEFETLMVQNGDSIIAGEILDRIENRVILEGAVMRPGNYELTEGLTLAGLIKNANGLMEDAFLERGQILRLDENFQLTNVSFDVKKVINGKFDVGLQREDVVTVYSIDELRQNRTLDIKGQVRNPGTFEFRDGSTLSDVIALAGGFTETASNSYIEVARRLSHEEAGKYQNKTGHLFQFTISRDMELDEKDSQFELQPYDQIFVRKAPGYSQTGAVKISGEILYAGDYNLANRQERLSSIIERAGGLTPEAYPEGAMLTRKVEINPKMRRLRQQLAERDSTLEFDDMGFEVLAIDLKSVLENPGTKEDVFLKEGDEIRIPRELQTVNVGGAVLNPVSSPFVKGKSLKYYVDQSGGFSNMAKKGKAYVIYPNGKAAATKKFIFFNNYPKVLPGSEIIIPEKPQRESLPASAWISIGSSVASLALTVVTISNALK
ncbi:SLBB domain-containing protein [Marinilabilia rubra]|uniref:Sugar transporter n=1 Tax=Marinilabilia rubra TaxID=2162893 RepID=A0A2U2B3M8_9BACT|nr:SLBB domain-containing protein [Marinilabilia rubra]PWD97672.1 sugar transporter [Marinilabilia rubra]